MKTLCILFSFLLLVTFTGCPLRSTKTDTAVSHEKESLVQPSYPIKLDSLSFEIRSIAWNPSGNLLAIMGGKEVRVYDANERKLLWRRTPGDYWYHGELTFIDDDHLVGTGNMGTIVCWKATEGSVMWKNNSTGTAACLRHCADKLVLVRGWGQIEEISPKTGRSKLLAKGKEELRISRFALSSDGTKLVCHDYGQKIRVFSSSDLRLIATLRLSGWHPTSLAALFHPVEPLIAINTLRGKTYLFDYVNEKEILRIPSDEPKEFIFSGSINKVRRPLAFTPDGKYLVAAVYPVGLNIIDINAKKALTVGKAWHKTSIICLAIAADSNRVAIADDEKNLWLHLLSAQGTITRTKNGSKE